MMDHPLLAITSFQSDESISLDGEQPTERDDEPNPLKMFAKI